MSNFCATEEKIYKNLIYEWHPFTSQCSKLFHSLPCIQTILHFMVSNNFRIIIISIYKKWKRSKKKNQKASTCFGYNYPGFSDHPPKILARRKLFYKCVYKCLLTKWAWFIVMTALKYECFIFYFFFSI